MNKLNLPPEARAIVDAVDSPKTHVELKRKVQSFLFHYGKYKNEPLPRETTLDLIFELAEEI